jgi:asparagine synthase (glutamine-hydrolysing)
MDGEFMVPTTYYCAGNPRFLDAGLTELARTRGAEAAWHEAVRTHGAAAAARTIGDFAVALRTDEGNVFAATDRFARQPICWTMEGAELRFSARADELGGGDLDPQSIFDYLYFHFIPSPRTIYRNVQRLPAAHALWLEKGRLTVRPYWEPAFREEKSPDLPALKAQFLDLVRTSVARQLDSSRSVACFLSGGTDSSTVAGMLGKVSGARAASYSIGFEAEGYDEMEYARIAARHFGTDHHEYYVTPGDLVSGIPIVAAHYDQPFGNSSALPAYYCARLAKSDGADLILAGDGGDELFGGNTRYAKQRVFEAWHSVPTVLRQNALEPLLADSGLFDRVPLARKGASYVRQARVPMPDRLQTYNLLERLGLQEVLSPAFLAQVDRGEPLRHQRETYHRCQSKSLVNRMLAFDWRYTLAENDLPKVVGTTALAGIDVGFPLLDHGLLEFSMRLPASYKLRGFRLRWFFKEALRGFLPDAIITKKKHGFGLPFGVWANRDPALRKLASDSLQGLVERGLLNARFVDRVFGEHLPAHPGYYGEIVWVSMMLEQWLRAKAPGWQVDR